MSYDFWKLTVGVIATIGLYSVLYRENKFYRFFEHMFLGLAAGWTIVALWTETLYDNWWTQMTGRVAEGTDGGASGYWIWMILLPIGLMGYFVFSKKHAWLSRIPIGMIIGLWAGQQFNVWMTKYGPQIQASTKPIFPTTMETLTRPTVDADILARQGMTPEQIAELTAKVSSNVYLSQAITNLIALITVLCVLSYFLFSFNFKSKFMLGMTKTGRYLLMVGFGAIFGSTVMMRFSLLIDRMYFIWVEWLQKAVLNL